MSDDITHNLTVVREALEAEGLAVHVKLIEAAIEDVAGLRAKLEDSDRMFSHSYELGTQWRRRAEIAESQLTSARKALTEIAALAHRWKWQFDLSEDQKPSGAQARNLITQGFDSLRRLGDQALKSRDSLTDDLRKPAPGSDAHMFPDDQR